ncbi:hypothetical protein [Saccharopolyspora hattusasensis]|uniref:hypothetical protein n=1 Tax=Saccharopolyspora hattusasensis TaxID=1128679 RepID=UPI003D9566AE
MPHAGQRRGQGRALRRLPGRAPGDRHVVAPDLHRGAHVRHFGITDNTGKPKPTLHELAAFADILSTADFDRCERTDAQAALVVTEFLGRGDSFSHGRRPTAHLQLAAAGIRGREVLQQEDGRRFVWLVGQHDQEAAATPLASGYSLHDLETGEELSKIPLPAYCVRVVELRAE